jgi:hypothetical protein
MAYQLNLSCFALFYPFFVTAPMVSFVATSRSTALAGALGHEKSKALTEKYLKGVTILSILGGIFVFLSALAVLVAAVLVSGGWFSGVIDSMRCEWWDINDEILDLASAAGIAVSPDPVIHPNTYVPYSPSISTCQYCQPGAAGVVLLVLFSILPTILVSVMCIFRLAKASAGARKWHKVELLITNVLCLISALWFFALGMLDTNSGTVIFTVFVWLHIVNSLIVPAVLNLTVRKEHAKTIDVVELPL